MTSVRAFSQFLAVALALGAGHALSQGAPPLKPNSGVPGKVQSIGKDSIAITSELGLVKVKLGPEVTLYKRVPSSLAKVTPKSFIGVTTVKQPDGSEMATEIHIFPESLRGAGEGSHRMGQPAAGASQSRMTNGTVSASKMTNGTVSVSRMTNGTVQKGPGQSTIVVNYGEGTQPVVIPPSVKVTEIAPTLDRPAKGDEVFFVPIRNADGSYTTTKITLTTPAAAK